MKYKVGDIVECIKVVDALHNGEITVGRQYQVLRYSYCCGSITILNNNGVKCGYAEIYFKNKV